ncbi:hypothetical protein ACHAW6_016192 [Cyclotella cf. meneghiniana]
MRQWQMHHPRLQLQRRHRQCQTQLSLSLRIDLNSRYVGLPCESGVSCCHSNMAMPNFCLLSYHRPQHVAISFQPQLEFVQSLASPAYLHYLATSGILYQSSFLDFLRYLRYWKRPEYAKYLIYPNCLYFLDLLVPPDDRDRDDDDGKHDGETDDGATEKASEVKRADRGEAFRREIAQVQFRNFVHEQQFYSWQFRSARLYGTGGASKEAKDEESHPESST